ncbi:MAG TPA: hypothetical protein DEB18_16445, partial [Leeuwenhoekiella sp.]|nr:hypothetical protein [Leeuwenhoekiella sp.]
PTPTAEPRNKPTRLTSEGGCLEKQPNAFSFDANRFLLRMCETFSKPGRTGPKLSEINLDDVYYTSDSSKNWCPLESEKKQELQEAIYVECLFRFDIYQIMYREAERSKDASRPITDFINVPTILQVSPWTRFFGGMIYGQ